MHYYPKVHVHVYTANIYSVTIANREVLIIKLTSLSSSWASDICGIALRGITRK